MTVGWGGSRWMMVVSLGRGSGRFRVFGVAVVELPHSPQNIAPGGNCSPQIWQFTNPLLPCRARTHVQRTYRRSAAR